MTCDNCKGTGYDPHNGGHIFNSQEEMDGTKEHACIQCPVPCPDCGGSGIMELQAELDKWDAMPSNKLLPGRMEVMFVDAARRVASGTPTYLVYTRQDDVEYLGHIYQGDEAERMAANPNLPGKWLLALGITEDK